jgi:phosphatidate phosphatase PAH1
VEIIQKIKQIHKIFKLQVRYISLKKILFSLDGKMSFLLSTLMRGFEMFFVFNKDNEPKTIKEKRNENIDNMYIADAGIIW